MEIRERVYGLDFVYRIIGFRSKKSWGVRVARVHMVGMTGQSSARTMWWKPMVYQATRSVSRIERFFLAQAWSPSR